ncbi:hypothetical protein [Tropicibacter sp. S64]|uniref:hypothetical protein n=1 Tax=Tropicibacter sp. S64 TaxID=3415122 RepID=UPI003C7A0E84
MKLSTVFAQSAPRPVSLVLFTAAAVLATLGDLLSIRALLALAGVALVGFVLLEFTRIRRPQQIAASLLLLAAVGVGLREGQLWPILSQGVLKTLPFILIFASVGWLRAAAGESPSLLALRRGLGRMQPGHRFTAVNSAAHVLGAGFNLAGMALLTPILDDVDDDPKVGRRMRCAILWGFSTAASWSPFLVGTAVVLASLPGVSWYQMAPYGAFIAFGFLVWATVFDRLTQRRTRSAPRAALEPMPALRGAAGRTLLAILLLFATTLTLIDVAGLRLTTAIALAAPGFGLVWLLLIHGLAGRARIAEVARSVVTSYPGMRTESTLFVAANIFGTAISTALPRDHDTTSALPWAGLSTGVDMLDILLMIWVYLAVCALGFHPIILLVVFTTVADPVALGLPLPMLGGVFMTLWGMGTSVSPLSGTTLFMSQYSKETSFEIAWRWNGLFYTLGAVWLAVAIVILR